MLDISKKGRGGIPHKIKPHYKRLEVYLKHRKAVGGASMQKPLDTLITTIKDQGSSDSCGGQANAYDVALQQAILTGTYTELSAKAPYSVVHLPEGGSSIPDEIGYSSNYGLPLESQVLSYEQGNPPSESFMESVAWVTHDLQDPTKNALLNGEPLWFDATKWQNVVNALNEGKGFSIAVGGTNPCWQNADILVPLVSQVQWWHIIKCLTLVERDGKPCVKFVNSWGKEWGDGGFGYLPMGYFMKGLVSSGVVTNGVPKGEYTLLMRLEGLLHNLISMLHNK